MLAEYLELVAKKWFKAKPRPFIDFAIKEIEKLWNEKNFFVIEAPTGYGKSTISATIALYSIKEEFKSIIAFPLRTLLEDQFHKFLKLGIAEEIIGKRYMHNPDSRYLIKPITLTTIDTLALNLFGVAPEDIEKVMTEKSLGHYFFSMFSVLFSNLVLDEVHLLADSTKSLSFLASLIKVAEKFDQKVILMSATLPEALKAKLREVSNSIEFIGFERDHDKEFYDERISKKYDLTVEKLNKEEKFRKILDWLKDNAFSKALVIFNTVEEARGFYRMLSDFNVLLIHSQFTEKDREEKINQLRKLEDGSVIVATQVIEAGVDISSDLLITDIAPASSLIQRFGRFLRYKEEEGRIFVWCEEMNGDFYKVYSRDLAERTLQWLKNKEMNVHLPKVENGKGFSEFLNFVYTPLDFKIDKKTIENFEGIFLHLERMSEEALELLFKLDGSFVREGLQVPVTFKTEIESPAFEFVKNSVVSLPFNVFKNLKSEVIKAFAMDEEVKSISRQEMEFLNKLSPQSFLRQTLRRKIFAFVIKADYDSIFGLRWKSDSGESGTNT